MLKMFTSEHLQYALHNTDKNDDWLYNWWPIRFRSIDLVMKKVYYHYTVLSFIV